MMSSFGGILTVLLLSALKSSNGVSCYTHDLCHDQLTYHHRVVLYYVPLGYQYCGVDNPMTYPEDGENDPYGYPHDREAEPLDYSTKGIDDSLSYSAEREEEALSYLNDGANFTYTGCEVNNVMYAGMISLDSMYLTVSDLSSSGCYWDTELYEDLEQKCMTWYPCGSSPESDTRNGCRFVDWYNDFSQDDKGDEVTVDTDDEVTQTSDNLTQYPFDIPATWLDTSDNTPSNTDYDNTAKRNASCCHGDTSSQDNDAVMRSKSCYECRSDPRGVCGDGFDPSSDSVKEVQCHDGCQKSVHSEFVSRGCLTSTHRNGCLTDVCVTELCTHCCIEDLCNAATLCDVHISLATVIFNLLALLLYTYLLHHGPD